MVLVHSSYSIPRHTPKTKSIMPHCIQERLGVLAAKLTKRNTLYAHFFILSTHNIENERMLFFHSKKKGKKYRKKGSYNLHMIIKPSIVQITGLEPARVFPPEPKSGASANSAISAYQME